MSTSAPPPTPQQGPGAATSAHDAGRDGGPVPGGPPAPEGGTVTAPPSGPEPARPLQPLAVVAVVLGSLSLALSFVPLVGLLGALGGLLAVVAAVVALVLIRSRRQRGTAPAWVGLGTGAAAVVVAGVVTVLLLVGGGVAAVREALSSSPAVPPAPTAEPPVVEGAPGEPGPPETALYDTADPLGTVAPMGPYDVVVAGAAPGSGTLDDGSTLEYVSVDLEITNTSGETRDLDSDLRTSLVASDGAVYADSACSDLVPAQPEAAALITALPPGGVLAASLCYDVPAPQAPQTAAVVSIAHDGVVEDRSWSLTTPG